MDVLNPFLSHNYTYLMKRWRAVAKKAGLKFSKIAEASSYPCYEVFSPTLSKSDGIYLSAGIHGDETGAVLGLLQWAEENIDTLSSLPLLIYPCINPRGLENNLRHDSGGLDLNRVWDEATVSPTIATIMKRVRAHFFRISIC
jgi:protein MpaA